MDSRPASLQPWQALTVPRPIFRPAPLPAASGAFLEPELPPPASERELADLDEVLPGLFLGSWRAAADEALLRACGITWVVNLCAADPEDLRLREPVGRLAKPSP